MKTEIIVTKSISPFSILVFLFSFSFFLFPFSFFLFPFFSLFSSVFCLLSSFFCLLSSLFSLLSLLHPFFSILHSPFYFFSLFSFLLSSLIMEVDKYPASSRRVQAAGLSLEQLMQPGRIDWPALTSFESIVLFGHPCYDQIGIASHRVDKAALQCSSTCPSGMGRMEDLDE